MKILLNILILIVIAIGVIYINPDLVQPLYKWLEQTLNFSDKTQEDATSDLTPATSAPKELTTKLSPARDISSKWVGSAPQGATYRQSSICEYDANIAINFTQNNNAVNGTISFTTRKVNDLDAEDFVPCPPTGYLAGDYQVSGTISGTYINFKTAALRGDPSLPIKFKGTLTSDIMSGTLERLPYSSSQLAEQSRISGNWIVTKSR